MMEKPGQIPIRSSASGAARYAAQRNKFIRSFVTPEGVDLTLEIARAGSRFGALLLDLMMMAGILLGVTFLAGYFSIASGAGDVGIIVWLLGFFLLRNFWFALFELGPRAATPGKRIIGIRVVARDGGRLTVAAVMARNLVREIEIFLPLTFLLQSMLDDSVDGWIATVGLLWAGGMGFFLLFNRDRMRLGDLIGGTWVVNAKRKKIAVDLASVRLANDVGAPIFSDAELAVYGVYELQQLERVLRDNDKVTIIAVSDAIRAKIGRPFGDEDRLFLIAYYRQAKARMERDLLFGKRRANKYEAPV